ncbi:MAG: F0F1 ATP synthase subunit gamma [Oscillatoriales cyanobacterium CG2_30_44_21]|nr:MAG: F0F1 ATP synthase subunit gamma [Oscillatoriales cyanobacterium CG2_30_44_21]
MASLELLQRQIHMAEELKSVVKMMKVLAAVNVHKYEQAVTSLSEYTRTIKMGLHVVLKSTPNKNLADHNLPKVEPNPLFTSSIGRCGVLIFGSEQGMCGQFNEQISRYAIAEIEKLQITTAQLAVFAIGSRIMPHLESEGYQIEENFAMPSSLSGITIMVQEMLPRIAAWRDRQQITKIILFYNNLHSNTSYKPSQHILLPLDRAWLQDIESQKWRSRTIPTFTMPSDVLISSLLRQYFFISLYRAFGESLASENASRLISMQVAEKNIEDRLTEFKGEFQQQRQSAITGELLEIVAGFELSQS